jgi:serine/threonine protein kinase
MSILKIERTTPGIVFGKLSYLSPEQARRGPLDGRVDIYAAGILLWELLTGRQLFPVDGEGSDAADRNIDALARARDPQVAPPSTITGRVPPELDRIVMRALAPEREDRYPNAEVLRADLAAFLAETAPKTDSERLAGFMRPLFADDAREERREREQMTVAARAMLSGGIGAPPAREQPAFPSDEHLARPGEDPRIGSTLGGRYHVRRLCGEGAMGRVYEAHHIDIGRRVAIKVLHASFHHSADLVERFRREARAASKIGHPNIVDVTDSGTTSDGAFYFVMEYLDGVNLEELINQSGPLPVERALLVAAQITRALDAAHTAEVIHRDLKPANVMLVNRKDEEDFVKVLDFGISKDLDPEVGSSLTRPNVAIGTPVYMAPEQAAGKEANALTDVYGVGGLLYEMLTGKPPCAGEDAIEVLHRKAREDPPAIGEIRPSLPGDVQRMVMRALARAPGDRQPSMGALKDQVLACLAAVEDAPTPVRVGGTSSITPRVAVGVADTVVLGVVPPPRHRARGRWVIGGLVALAGVLLAVRLARQDAPEPGELGMAPSPQAPAEPLAPPSASSNLVPVDPEPSPKPTAPTGRVVDSPSLREPAPAVSRVSVPPRRSVAAAPAEAPSAKAGGAPAAALDTAATLSRGQMAFDRGDYPEAVRRGREAIAAGAEVPGRLLIGDAYYRLDRFRDALREYDAALALEPTSASIRRRRDLAEKKTVMTDSGP